MKFALCYFDFWGICCELNANERMYEDVVRLVGSRRVRDVVVVKDCRIYMMCF